MKKESRGAISQIKLDVLLFFLCFILLHLSSSSFILFFIFLFFECSSIDSTCCLVENICFKYSVHTVCSARMLLFSTTTKSTQESCAYWILWIQSSLKLDDNKISRLGCNAHNGPQLKRQDGIFGKQTCCLMLVRVQISFHPSALFKEPIIVFQLQLNVSYRTFR